MLKYACLTSGSCGNAYVFYDGTAAILIDMGLTLTGLRKRLAEAEVPYEAVSALFLTHLHPDHVKGAGVLERSRHVRIYLSQSSREGGLSILSRLGLKDEMLSLMSYGESVTEGGFTVTNFRTSHDSQGSVGYYICHEEGSFFLMTDTGIIPEDAPAFAALADVLFIESNYDEAMLETGPYPYVLKRRVRGERGHLSNTQARDFIKDNRLRDKSIYFIHVSANNNTPEKIEDMISTLDAVNAYTVCERGKSYTGSICRPKTENT